MSHRVLRGSIAALIVSLLVAGCGSDGPVDAITSLNPFKSEEQKLPGERRAALPGTDPAAQVAGQPASIGAPAALADWSQPGGNPANDPGNVAGSVTGTRSWSVRAGEPGSSGRFGFSSGKSVRVSARPVAVGGFIYVYDPSGNVSAHSVTNGGRSWRVNVRPGGERDSVSGGGLSVAGGKVFVATGYGEMIALDAGNGATLWRVRIDAPARSAPTAAGGLVFAVAQSGAIIALDQATGKEVWTASSGGTGAGLLGSSSPAVAGNLMVAPTSSGEILAFDAASGAPKWGATVAGGSRASAVTSLQDASASPVIHDGIVYATGVGGALIAVSAATGETVWSQTIGSAHTPIVSGGALFLIDLDDRMVAFDRAKGTALWATQLPVTRTRASRTTWAGPVLVGGRLTAVSVDGSIIQVDARTGEAGAPSQVGLDGAIAPIVVNGGVVVLGGDGTLSALN